VKIKWLALITWIANAYYFFTGSWPLRLQILASVGNFLLFFSRDIVQTMRYRKRVMATSASRFAAASAEPEARHRCRVCGKTDLTNPEMDFRYCSKCAGDECYCPEHIFAHEHVPAKSEAAKK
jgi:ribosomal protein L37AE/L43A